MGDTAEELNRSVEAHAKFSQRRQQAFGAFCSGRFRKSLRAKVLVMRAKMKADTESLLKDLEDELKSYDQRPD